MYRWELDDPAQPEFDGLGPETQAALTVFMDAVVLVNPVEYQHHPGERSDPPALPGDHVGISGAQPRVSPAYAEGTARNGALAGKETAEATREATATAQEAARQARIGYQITFHAGRLEALADLHRFVSWVTEGGRPPKELTWSEQHLVVTGIPKPTTIVEGYELKGMIAATGVTCQPARR